MAASDWIDTSGNTPTLRPLAAATGVFSTIIVGWWAGFLDFIGSAGGGIWGSIDAVRAFLASPGGVIPWLFAIADGAMDAAAAEHAQWLATFGVLAQVVAVVEVSVLVVILVWALQAATRRVLGGI